MRVRLEQMQLAGLDLELSPTSRVGIARADGVRGAIVIDGERLEASGVVVGRLELAKLALQLGKVAIEGDPELVLEALQGTLTRCGDAVVGELEAQRAVAPRLVVTVGEVAVSGRIELANVRLHLDGAAGQITAEQVVISELALAVGRTALGVDRLVGTSVTVAWGGPGLRVDATALELASGTIRLAFEDRPPAPAAPPRDSPGLVIDEAIARLLDGLAGQLDVDLVVDLTVPVLGRRRATHPFRIPIANGTLDFMRLETDLSALEDSVLDFAMRGNDLVLERGLPLLPTRGLGKPILHWDLEGYDSELARGDRIRLAMLPRFTLAGDKPKSGSGAGKPAVALHRLEIRGLDAKLRAEVAQPSPRLPIHRIAELALAGNVYHDVNTPPRAGELRVHIAGVEAGAGAFAIGSQICAFERASVARIADARAEFMGLAPRAAEAALGGVVVVGLRFGPRAEPTA